MDDEFTLSILAGIISQFDIPSSLSKLRPDEVPGTLAIELLFNYMNNHTTTEWGKMCYSKPGKDSYKMTLG